MKKVLDAIYKDGVFEPLENPEMIEGQLVQLVIEFPKDQQADDILSLAAQVYDGLSTSDIEEVEEISKDRSQFFSQ